MTIETHSLAWQAGALLLGLAFAPAARGIDLEAIDRTVAPGDDFFAYANGNWLRKTEIPADRKSYGTASLLDELTSERTAPADRVHVW